MEALAESVMTFGAYCSELVHNGCSIKDDDLFYSQFGFSGERSKTRVIIKNRMMRWWRCC